MGVYIASIDASPSGGGGNAYINNFYQTTSSVGIVPLSSTVVAGGIANPLPMIKAQFDGKIYIGNNSYIDRVDPSQSSISAATTLKAIGSSGEAVLFEWYITAMGEWNNLLVVATNNEPPGDFTRRNGGGSSRVFFFDVVNNPTSGFKPNFVNSPSHYISVLFTDLTGNLLAFGGVDEGRSTIYQYNGYGFIPLFSYIGDLPRNRHSVCYDAQGRLMWQTAAGQICRLSATQVIAVSEEEQASGFENMGFTATSTGGIVTNLQALGYDFLVSGGTGLYNMRVTGGVFTGTGSTYGTNTPVAISGLQDFPHNSIIRNVTVYLNKALQSGESLDVNLYSNESTDFLVGKNIGSLNYANDGAVATKNIRTLQTGIDTAAFGVAWTTSNGTTTVPGLLKMDVTYNEITSL